MLVAGRVGCHVYRAGDDEIIVIADVGAYKDTLAACRNVFNTPAIMLWLCSERLPLAVALAQQKSHYENKKCSAYESHVFSSKVRASSTACLNSMNVCGAKQILPFADITTDPSGRTIINTCA